jgi:hypothetical protein
MSGACSTYGKDTEFIKNLVGNPEKRPFWRCRHRWKNNIKMDLKEIGCGGGGVDSLELG